MADTLRELLDEQLPDAWRKTAERRRRVSLLAANFLGHPTDTGVTERRYAAQRAVADSVDTTPEAVEETCLEAFEAESGSDRRDCLEAALSAVEEQWQREQSGSQALYVARVPDHRLKLFADTVDSPYEFSATAALSDTLAGREACRLWGVTAADCEPEAFEELGRGDVVAFADDDRLFAAGIVEETYESEAIARKIWNTGAYQYIYTLSAYQRIDLPSEHFDGEFAELGTVSAETTERVADAAETVWNYLTRFYTTDNLESSFPETDFDSGLAAGRRLRDDPVSSTAPYYWVAHETRGDADAGYLQVPRTDEPHHDLQKLTVDDVVFDHYDGRVLGYSEVTTPAYLVTDRDGSEYRRVDVDTTRFDEPIPFADFYPVLTRADVRLDDNYPLGVEGPTMSYLHNLSRAAGEFLLGAGGVVESGLRRIEQRLGLPDLSVTIPGELYFPDVEKRQLRQQIEATLNAGRHLILTGPPGTGKSKLAREIARQATETPAVDGFTFATATAEWSTFDTVGGYVPDPDGDGLTFDQRLFLNCFRGETGIENNWLVVDELNRANIDEALGPLFSVLAGDSVTLPYERDDQVQIDWIDTETPIERRRAVAASTDRFPVTPAWRLVGTTNTVDKASLYDLSFAFMRRFGFVHVGVPALSTDDGATRGGLLDPAGEHNYATVWTAGRPEFEQTVTEWFRHVAVVWRVVNDYRTVGPAVVRDLLEFIDAYESGTETAPLDGAVVNFLFPQLEALRESAYGELLSDLSASTAVVDADGDRKHITPKVDTDYLGRKAADFFGLDTPPTG